MRGKPLVTFFGETSLLTFRAGGTLGEARVTRFIREEREALCLEIYDDHREFCAGIGPRPECSTGHQELWRDLLQPLPEP